MARQFVISSSGTIGDLFPLLSLSRELLRGGNSVTFLTSNDHADLVSGEGAEFVPIGDGDWPQDGRDDVEFWRCAVVPSFDKIMEYLTSRFQSGDRPILICRSSNWAFRTFGELHGTSFVRVFLQPSAINEWSRWMPPVYRQMLDRFRSRWGLAAQSAAYYKTDPAVPGLSLFPEWFGEPESRSPRAGACVGFPFYHGAGVRLPRQVESFKNEFDRFALFSASSGQADMSALRRTALEFSRETGLPTLVLTSPAAAKIERLGSHVLCCGRIDHASLLPHSIVAVHSGGIGTVAQCIRAGVPQIIMPLRYDQPDNARRVQLLGLGISCTDTSPGWVARAYFQLMADAELPARLRDRANMVRQQDAQSTAVAQILSFSSFSG